MAVTVYVWTRSVTHVGHASIAIGSDVYASFWPGDAAGKKDLKVKRSHQAAYPSTYEMDREQEGGREATLVQLHGLDEVAMGIAWSDVQTHGLRYNLLRQNCSTIVALLLEKGSGRLPTFRPSIAIADWINSPLGVRLVTLLVRNQSISAWTPEQVLHYARELLLIPKDA
jgi:hypothetical protein